MTMPIILLDSSFGDMQDRSRDHLDRMSRTCIFNLFHMCKVGLIYPTCIRDVSHTPTDAYILERLGVHLTHNVWRIFFSLDGVGAVIYNIYRLFFVWVVLGYV